MSKLDGKVAIVTGASKGIGASIARHLAAAGASIVVNYASSKEDADKIVSAIDKDGGKAIAVKADVSQTDEVDRLFSETQKAFGRLDILVNNAAVYEFSPLETVTVENFHKQFNINVLGPILTIQQAVQYFGESGGSVINISSLISVKPVPNSTIYSATKGALDTVTRTLAAELGPRKIRVNAISPGMVETEGSKAIGAADPDSEFRKFIESNTSLGRIGQPDDIGPTAAFLASDDAAWITGENWGVSGGLR